MKGQILMTDVIIDENYVSDNLCEFSKERLRNQPGKQKKSVSIQDKNGYNNWLQFNLDMMPQWISLNSDHPSAVNAFLFIIAEMDGYNNLMCSQRVICDAIGVSLSTVTKALVFLKKRKFLKTTKWGNTNVYHVNSEIIWKSWGANKVYAEFTEPDVLFSDDEKASPKPINYTKKEVMALIGKMTKKTESPTNTSE